MKIIPRILLWLYALGVAVVCVVLLVQYAGFDVLGTHLNVSNNGASIAIIFLLVSIFFLFYRTNGRAGREPQTISHTFEHGDVKITYETLEQLATRAAMTIRGIKDLKTRVRTNPENNMIRIAIQCYVEGETDIPKTTSDLQTKIKSSVENSAGILVEQVTVYVIGLSAPKEVVKKRVE